MKVVVDRGYNLETKEEALEMFRYLRKELGAFENTVVDSTPEKWSNLGDYLYKVAINANNMKGNLFLSININKGETKKGIIYGKEDSINLRIFKELSESEFEISIIEEMENLYLLKNIKYKSVILTFTITTRDDIKVIGEKIVKTLTN